MYGSKHNACNWIQFEITAVGAVIWQPVTYTPWPNRKKIASNKFKGNLAHYQSAVDSWEKCGHTHAYTQMRTAAFWHSYVIFSFCCCCCCYWLLLLLQIDPLLTAIVSGSTRCQSFVSSPVCCSLFVARAACTCSYKMTLLLIFWQ